MIEFSKDVRPRGVLKPKAGEKRMRLTLHRPASELSEIVEHYWMVEWDLDEGDSYRQYTIPHPCVHLVVAPQMCGVFGVMSRLFSYLMSGTGRAFGIKFHPGAFRSLTGDAVCRITDGRFPIGRVLGEEGVRYEDAVLASSGTAGELSRIADDFLRARRPVVDETQRLIGRIVRSIIADRDIIRVENIVARFRLGKRQLQRIFREYVGVSPKWVIGRYRLLEAAERLAKDDNAHLADLAQELGYFDQSHFARDFKGLIGSPPAEYARSAREG